MAIPIIGGQRGEEPEIALPEPAVDLPEPDSAAPAHWVLTPEVVAGLLDHPEASVRAYALERAEGRLSPPLTEALLARLDDEDDLVFGHVVSILAEHRAAGAADRVQARFEQAQGRRAAALGATLGRLAPERLFEATKSRGRLDDDAFPSVMTALAVVATDEVRRFFEKALSRARMQSPDRRRALYTAILILGDPKLAGRVLGEAVGDSNAEAPEGSTYPTRAALGAVAGLPLLETRIDRGEALFEQARVALTEEVLPELSEESARALSEALGRKAAGSALRALEPLLALEIPNATRDDDDLGTAPERRQGLLRALVERAKDIDRLDPAAAAVFLVAGAQAAGLVVAGGAPEATSSGMIQLARALEVDPEVLAQEGIDALIERLSSRSARDMRRVHTLVVRHRFRRKAVLERILEAIARAGHAAGLLHAAAEVEEPELHRIVVETLAEAPESAEAAVLEILGQYPLEDRSARLALALAETLGTERVGLAVGRRFFELRKLDRGLTARVALATGDARLLPLLESRAFPQEPEQAAWAVLSLVHGRPREGRLEQALADLGGVEMSAPELRVELLCRRCGETGLYRFARAYVDPAAKDETGDPAFVGRVTCKACGARDTLRPTAAGSQVLVAHLMHALELAQKGQTASDPLLVTPAQMTIAGKKVGLAEGLRRLDRLVDESPQSPRIRLERARLLMLLDRDGVAEDLAAVREVDSDSVEALIIEASQAAKAREPGAVDLLVEAYRRLKSPEPPRIYDAVSVEGLRESVEALLLQLSELSSSALPQDVDLGPAKRRRAKELSP